MMRLVVIGLLLLSSGVNCMIVRRQTNPDCPFELLPVLNVCPPCQPSGCHCVDGKELTLDDQRVAEESKTPPCAVADQNPYGFPARCDCLPPGQGFSFQDLIDQVRAAAAAAAAAGAQQQQQGELAQKQAELAQQQQQQQEQLAEAETEATAVEDPQQVEEKEEEAQPGSSAPTCPRPVLPILNACPPCTPTGCFCADGKELSLEDQAKAHQNQTPPCPISDGNPYGLPARCSCADPGTGFTFQEILAVLAQQQG